MKYNEGGRKKGERWREKIAGTFAQSEHYDEAMRLGREYREAQRPPDDEETG